MMLQHLVVATDESEAGRAALRRGVDLARRSGARLTVMTTVPVGAALAAAPVHAAGCDTAGGPLALAQLQHWAQSEAVGARAAGVALEFDVAFGVPGVEICRYAEENGADLLILGRKARTQATRLLVGDTADAVSRRSQIPCLFVPDSSPPVERVLVALDGSRRGQITLETAADFATAVDAEFCAVTVEPIAENETVEVAATVPATRSRRLMFPVQELARRVAGARACQGGGLRIRHGEIVTEVLAEVEDTNASVLVVGYHRGGLPGVIEAGSVSRHLAHSAPCSVLTVPL